VTLCTADFERGVSGSNILTSDPGSATPWDSTTHAGGDVITYDNAHVYGTLAAKVDSTTSGGASANTLHWSTGIGTLTNWYGRVYLYATTNPGGTYRVVSDPNGNFPLYINAGGTVSMADQGGFAITTTTSIALNQWVRIEWHWINSATVGQVEVKLFNNPDSPTSTETLASAANRNTSVSTTDLDFGLTNGGGSPGPIWLDNIVAGATSYPGPATQPIPSTAFVKALGW